MKRSELIDNLRQSRKALFEALAGLSEDELSRPKTVGQGSLAELAGHIAAWDEEVIRILQAFAMPGETRFSYSISPDHDFAAWNAQQAALRQGRSPAEAMQELEQARRDLIQIIDGLTEQVLRRERPTPWGRTVSGYDLVQIQIEHEEEHREQILSWRKKMERWKRARAKLSAKRKQAESG